MADQMNLPNTVIATEEILNVGSIVNQALIDILIDKQVISAEELVNYIGKISLAEGNLINGPS